MMLTDYQIAAVRRAVKPLGRLKQDAMLAELNSMIGDRPTVGNSELHHLLRRLKRIYLAKAHAADAVASAAPRRLGLPAR